MTKQEPIPDPPWEERICAKLDYALGVLLQQEGSRALDGHTLICTIETICALQKDALVNFPAYLQGSTGLSEFTWITTSGNLKVIPCKEWEPIPGIRLPDGTAVISDQLGLSRYFLEMRGENGRAFNEASKKVIEQAGKVPKKLTSAFEAFKIRRKTAHWNF